MLSSIGEEESVHVTKVELSKPESGFGPYALTVFFEKPVRCECGKKVQNFKEPGWISVDLGKRDSWTTTTTLVAERLDALAKSLRELEEEEVIATAEDAAEAVQYHCDMYGEPSPVEHVLRENEELKKKLAALQDLWDEGRERDI